MTGPKWQYPPLAALATDATTSHASAADHTDAIENALTEHGAAGRVIVRSVGPQLVRYAVKPATGVLPAKIARTADGLSVATGQPVRVAGVEGEHVMIEVPREHRDVVPLRAAIESSRALVRLGFPLGLDGGGAAVTRRLADLPHLIVAGSTGGGKSGFVNSLLVSLLMRNTPDDLQLVLIDPKRVELAPYAGLPHVAGEVIDDMRDAARALENVVNVMEARYEAMASAGVRDVERFNNQADRPFPRLVVVVDELADLLMTQKPAEDLLVRIAQKGRAAGVHLVLATQRPAADTITRRLSANIPARVAFAVPKSTDSRIILDVSGAELLTGRGDGLWKDSASPRPVRFQSPWVTEEEVERVVALWIAQAPEVDAPEETVHAAADRAREAHREEREARERLDAYIASQVPEEERSYVAPADVVADLGLSASDIDAVAEVVSEKIMDRVMAMLAATEKKEAS